MPSTISRTYGKKAPTKHKNSPSSEENYDTKRRRVATEEEDDRPALVVPSTAKATTATPVATPTKLTKRMLGRSKTESSIDSQHSASAPSRTSSLPIIPSPEEQSGRRPALSASTSTPRVKRTYAGQSRSFLVSLPVSELNPGAFHGAESQSQEDGLFEPESYSSLRLRWGVDHSEEDPPLPITPPSKVKSNSNQATPSRKAKGKAPALPLPPNMMNPLKSITELRSKGESRRFLDEVGYLFEGMDPSNTTGLKRSSASEITVKLCDDEFARKAKAADFYYKTWDVFLKAGAGRGEDKILDILLIFLVALIARNAAALLDLVNSEPSDSDSLDRCKGKLKAESGTEFRDSLISILFFVLKTFADVDPLAMVSPSRSATDIEFKQIGLSKKDKIILSSIYATISTRSNLFPDDTPITTSLLIIHVLETLPPSLLPIPHITDLLHSLRSLLQMSFPHDEPFNGAYPSDEVNQEREPQYHCIKAHLHLIDLYLLGQWSAGELSSTDTSGQISSSEINAARDKWFVDGLVAVAVCAEMKLRGFDDAGEDMVSECLEIILRVLVNLTHGDPNWARSVISNDFAIPLTVRLVAPHSLSGEKDTKTHVEDLAGTQGEQHRGHAWDRLCLALGLLTNLVQNIPKFKDKLRQTKISSKCTLSNPSCTKKCTCPEQIGALELLVRIYNSSPPTNTHYQGIKHEPSPTPPPPASPVSAEGAAVTSLIQGSLSILFGLLMASSKPNQTIILSAIYAGEQESEATKLGKLVDQAKEFVTMYDIMSSGDEKEEMKSAKEVVRILERLRDTS